MVTDARIPLVDLPYHGFFPIIVIGWEGDGPTASRIGNLVTPLTRVGQQYGGYACMQTELVGLVLRLGANLGDPAPLMKAFESIAESVGRASGPLRRLGYTHGDDYSRDELGLLDAVLTRYVTLPRVESGQEARVRFVEADLGAWFAGWRIWRALGPLMYWDGTLATPVDETMRVTPELLATIGPAPRAYLLWENSD